MIVSISGPTSYYLWYASPTPPQVVVVVDGPVVVEDGEVVVEVVVVDGVEHHREVVGDVAGVVDDRRVEGFPVVADAVVLVAVVVDDRSVDEEVEGGHKYDDATELLEKEFIQSL